MLRKTRLRVAEAAANEEIQILQKENDMLRQQLEERASDGATKSGYLNKFRPHATSSLWANTWEVRYVILRGQQLTYFRSERDMAYLPRGQINLNGTYLDIEGLKRRKFWTFKVVDRAGVDLVRLSTEVQSEFSSWVEALERAGCTKRVDEDSMALSPGPSQTSPGNSAISDSDTATSGRIDRDRGYEVDSHPSSDRLNQLRSQPSGYTSDASDVAPQRLVRQRSNAGSRRNVDRGGRHGHDTCAPVHTQPRFSLLSSERITFSNQSGLLTLVFIVLAATNFRLVLENIIKYGLRFNPITFLRDSLTPTGNVWLLLCWPGLAAGAAIALCIERFAAGRLEGEFAAKHADKKKDFSREECARRAKKRELFTETVTILLTLINTTAALLGPFTIIHITDAEPLPGFMLTLATTVMWLKLVSFAHVNWSLRGLKRVDRRGPHPGETSSGTEPQCVDLVDDMYYPANLTLGNIGYFIAAPTLCYQLSYPRSARFRLRWVFKRIGFMCMGLALMLFILEQYIEPTIDNSLKPLQEMDWLRMVERVLKLSVPTLYFWLAMFYTLFELWLNILAEFTRFGDREFYKEWWNATTLGEYWRLWNMPVHKWMLRHVYFPSLRAGMPKFAAGVVVFFFSAVFHEVLVGVPLHMLRGWAFWGIMAQVPLMWATELLKRKFKSDRVGNVIFWVSFCFLGQPLAEILYFHDYRKLHGHS